MDRHLQNDVDSFEGSVMFLNYWSHTATADPPFRTELLCTRLTDNEAPNVNCSENITQNVDPGTAEANVTWSPEPMAYDVVDGDLTPTCRNQLGDVVESPDLYPIGVTEVTCTASDKSDNEGACSFTITVIGKTPSLDLCFVEVSQHSPWYLRRPICNIPYEVFAAETKNFSKVLNPQLSFKTEFGVTLGNRSTSKNEF